jgi:hypothetical protein
LAAGALSASRKALIVGLALTGTRSVVVGSPNAALRPAPGLAPPRWSFEFVTNSNYRTEALFANRVFFTTPKNLEFNMSWKKQDSSLHALQHSGGG